MFGFFNSNQSQGTSSSFPMFQKQQNDSILTLNLQSNAVGDVLTKLPFQPKLVLGFVSRSLDFS